MFNWGKQKEESISEFVERYKQTARRQNSIANVLGVLVGIFAIFSLCLAVKMIFDL